MTEERSQIDLKGFLTEKLVEWYEDPDMSEADQLREACALMAGFLSNRHCSDIVDANSPNDAVVQFMYAIDSEVAWSQVEKELNEMSQADLDECYFPDLVHYLTLL